jgi:hypothetical protein
MTATDSMAMRAFGHLMQAHPERARHQNRMGEKLWRRERQLRARRRALPAGRDGRWRALLAGLPARRHALLAGLPARRHALLEGRDGR